MKIAICDDSKETIIQIQKLIDNYFEVSEEMSKDSIECYHFTNGEELICSKINFDIAFLDIVMTENSLDGISVGRILKQRNPYIKIIMITSYMHYLDDAMEFRVFRYLHKEKNFSVERFNRALSDAYREYMADTRKIVISSKAPTETLSINVHEIIYVRSKGRSVSIQTCDALYKSVDGKFKEWKEKLGADFFFESYRGEIINFEYVYKILQTKLILKYKENEYEAYLSRSKSGDFKKLYANYCKSRGVIL